MLSGCESSHKSQLVYQITRFCIWKLKVKIQSSCLLQAYVSKVTNGYQVFEDHVTQPVYSPLLKNFSTQCFHRLVPTVCNPLMKNFGAHIGDNNEAWKSLIGRHTKPVINENDRFPHYEYFFPTQMQPLIIRKAQT